jgi:hypothetical protein
MSLVATRATALSTDSVATSFGDEVLCTEEQRVRWLTAVRNAMATVRHGLLGDGGNDA